jgi:plastocyanin
MTHRIKVTQQGISQGQTKLEAGDSVAWDGSDVFSVQGTDGEWGSDGLVSGHGAYIHLFKQAGNYPYNVKIHGLLVAFAGIVTVTE